MNWREFYQLVFEQRGQAQDHRSVRLHDSTRPRTILGCVHTHQPASNLGPGLLTGSCCKDDLSQYIDSQQIGWPSIIRAHHAREKER